MAALVVALGVWLSCSSGELAAAVATSYPEGFCETTNWLQSSGTGTALIAVGVAGVVTRAGLLLHTESVRPTDPLKHRPSIEGVSSSHLTPW